MPSNAPAEPSYRWKWHQAQEWETQSIARPSLFACVHINNADGNELYVFADKWELGHIHFMLDRYNI